MKKLFLTIIVTMFFGIVAYSQTLTEATDLYNGAVVKVNEKNYQTAIDDFQACLNICEKIGADAAELTSRCKTGIYQTTYSYANEMLRNNNFSEALPLLDKVIELAESECQREAITIESKNEMIESIKSKKSSIYAKQAKDQYNLKVYDEVIRLADLALSFNPENITALFYKGRSYEKQGNLELMEDNFTKCIALTSNNPKEAAVAENVKKSARSAYIKAAQAFIQAGQKLSADQENEKTAQLEKAFEMLQKVEFYGMDANAYYHLALVNNGLKKFQAALDAANTGLPLETKNKSNFYYMIGMAYEGLDNTTEACKNYKLVTDGGYVKPAIYQREQVLKCEN
ncbi:MAG: hypothetical protein PHR53_05025 [Bacteroidales bacterium]|nr:hypothetical protein [Bacteroidales bacterium]